MTQNQSAAPASAIGDGIPDKGRRPPWILIGIALLLAAGLSLWWWLTRNQITTDDAFIQSDITLIAPRVAGTVMKVYVQDNQPVKAGELLFELDPAPLTVQVESTQANLAAAQSQVQSAQANLTMTQTTAPAAIAQAQAALRAAQAQAARADADVRRYESLYAKDEVSQQQLEQVRTNAKALRAEAQAASAGLASAQTAPQQGDLKSAMLDAARAAVQQAQTSVDLAKLQLSYTHIVAPSAGHITRKNLQVGTQVQAGNPVLSLVGDQPWIVANFKETQLERMRRGQPVAVRVDAYPDVQLSARVESLQAGTGSAFSLLPAENASGNYVKVVQRLPVKLVFDAPPPADLHLVPGMSVVPSIDVSKTAGPRLEGAQGG